VEKTKAIFIVFLALLLMMFPLAAACTPGEKEPTTPAAEEEEPTPPPPATEEEELTLIRAPLPTDEERALAKYIADEIFHAIVSSASQPEGLQFRKGSYASVTQDYLRTKSPQEQKQIKEKADSLLRAPLSKREQIFGRFANEDATLHTRLTEKKDSTLEVKLKTAFNKELEVLDSSGVFPTWEYTVLTNTQLYIESSGGDNPIYRTNLDIYEPERLWFRWETEEPEATHARWEIEFPPGHEVPEMSWGSAGTAPWGNFDIDFSDFLPETPPNQPITYQIRVQPTKVRELSGLMAVTAEAIGQPSNLVRITYKKQDWVQPELELPPETGYYQSITFCVNTVECIEETAELSASDEIILGGFYTLASGRVVQMPTWKVSDDFDEGEVEPAQSQRPVGMARFMFFHMDATGGNLLALDPCDGVSVPWPRIWAFTLVMGEEDHGGFDEFLTEIINYVIDEIGAAVEGAIAGAIVGSFAGPLGTLIGGVIGAVVGEIFDLIKEVFDDPDDMIAERTYVLVLDSCKASYIHSLPGQVNELSDGTTEFVSNPQVIRFEGGDDSAGGIYDVEVFWKLSNRVLNY